MSEIFAAVDLSAVSAFVSSMGVLIMGITLAFKGVDLGKRGIKKA